MMRRYLLFGRHPLSPSLVIVYDEPGNNTATESCPGPLNVQLATVTDKRTSHQRGPTCSDHVKISEEEIDKSRGPGRAGGGCLGEVQTIEARRKEGAEIRCSILCKVQKQKDKARGAISITKMSDIEWTINQRARTSQDWPNFGHLQDLPITRQSILQADDKDGSQRRL
ncbi:hypothetical protein RRG08_019573 [Elysia crispata]|uniref:Uncharacterized protein n=1 Tax=Elysia crispata TaxID=231223 RepID=A0AAE0YRB7_9GAST|nr:hypothetical protein RRG08_019573 [Elysia crispata]